MGKIGKFSWFVFLGYYEEACCASLEQGLSCGIIR
jgi:hypothetical protein